VRVHLLDVPADEHLALLSAVSSELELTSGAEVPHDTRVLVGGWPTEDQLPEAVEAVVVPFAGVPARTRDLALTRGLAVYNQHHNAPLVAELAVTLLLAAAKRLVPLDRALRQGDWTSRSQADSVRTLAGSSVLVVGFGAVGRATARLLRGLGMHVVGIRRSGPGVVDGVEVHGPDQLDRCLGATSAVVLAVPATPETTGLLDAKRLALLEDGAVVVNVARARVVDETALFEALRSGRLSAGLDVWYRYPGKERPKDATLPADLPFHELDNVVLSPHRGGLTADTERMRYEAVAVTLRALLTGTSPPHPIDLERGY
jgi:phosphoglycerate dehydrogenase-like enzyme